MLKTMLRLTEIRNIIISEAYKYTIKMIAKIVSGWITDDFEYVPFIVLLCFR